MKKLLLVFLFSSISLLTFSQNKERPTYDSLIVPYDLEPFTIYATLDNGDFGVISEFKGSKSLWAKDSKLSKGFEMSIVMVQDSTITQYPNKLHFLGIRLRTVGIGRNCIEHGSTFVLELEDGEKLSYSYTENFICNDINAGYFRSIDFGISWEVWEKLFNTRVKSMSFTEKRTGESFTYKLKKEEQEFFMEVKEATTRIRYW
ncbi:MAG: hypothetical protein RLZZ358_533 [Bacteroidota bacterium]|jgi:hypothetical protein